MAKKKQVKPRAGKRQSEQQTSPKKRASRQQRYRAQQRKSWLGFLGKLALFFVPVTLATVWLVWLLIGFGTELPILVLDLGNRGASDPTESKRQRVWDCETYGRASKDGGIKLPEAIVYGGPNKDALVIFNDLLATARDADGQLEPCVFIPATGEEHQSHAFFGLLNDPTQQHQQQWTPFKSYLIDILNQLALQTPNRSEKKKILLAFDIDHPDLPGRLPPQANQFIGLFQSQWDSLRIELAQTFPQFDVHVWLSHASGQKSYWDSNPSRVESFFKHRFERGLTGDVCIEIPLKQRSKRDVNYSHLKQYVGKRVTSDANIHNLVQTPVFLEPQSMTDFPLLRFSVPLQSPVAEPGKLFGYRKRDKLDELDRLWEKFQRVRHEYDWAIENPLAVQQTNMMLLQMERLWYEGKDYTELFAELNGRVGSLLDTHHTLKPVQHSLSDALADAQRMDVNFAVPEKLKSEWLVALLDDELQPESDQRSDIEAKSDARAKAVRKWQAKYPDWRGAHLVWQALVVPPGGIIDRQMIQQGFNLLTNEQTLANKNTQGAEQVVFDEVMFLQRLINELVWPDKDSQSDAHTNFERLVRSALIARDKSNRFAATLTPVLTDQFKTEFEALEVERRLCEDRLFAHDELFGTGSNRLSIKYPQLIRQYEQLSESSAQFALRFADAQSKLINSCHNFRYRVESLASAESESSETDWIGEYFDKVGKLSQAKIKAFFQSNPADELSETSSTKLVKNNLTALSDANLNLGVADGNLLGRRLLFSPELSLQDRSRLHEGLSTQYVTLDEDENGGDDVVQKTLTPAGGLAELFIESLHQLPAMQTTTESVDVPSSEEQFLLQAAAKSSRLTPFQSHSDNGQSLVELINGFHARKSDLDFRRTSYDLCGTSVADGRSYVQESLTMHQQLIEDRLSELANRKVTSKLSSLRERIGDVWRSAYDKPDTLTWRKRLQQVDKFCDGFRRWDWDREQQQAVNRSLAEPMNYQVDQNNKMIFSVSPVGAVFDNIAKAVADRSNSSQVALSTQKLAEASTRLRLYLRGHKFELESQAAGETAEDRLTVKLKNQAIEGLRIEVKRTTKSPLIGRVKILIDCSNSMGSGPGTLMDKSKKYVESFLESAAERADIEVSLYAFGVHVIHDKSGKPKYNPNTPLDWVRVNKTDDVWRYQGNGKRLDTSTRGDFIRAVNQLDGFGETPILDALDLALAEVVKGSQLLVLLTDGCEFHKKAGNRQPQPLNQGKYQNVRKLLQQPSNNLVIFNMMKVNVQAPQLNALNQRQQKILMEKFKGTSNSQFGMAEIVGRIWKINSLADYYEGGGGANLNQLQKFFAGVLPRPVVERTPAFYPSSAPNVALKGAEPGVIRSVQLGPTDQPKSWHLSMLFRTTNPKIKVFNKNDKQWQTDRQTYGNERLDFDYDPFAETFKLVTAWEPKDSSKDFLVGSQKLLVHSDPSRPDKPSFLVASDDSQLLTPSPAMAWAVLSQAEQGRQLLLQDFNLKQQTRSNVHRIEFPKVEDLWEQAAIFQNGTLKDLTLHWLDRFPADFWSKLNLTDVGDKLITNENGVQIELLQGRFVTLEKLFQMDAAPFKGFDFQLKYENLGNKFLLTTRISFVEEADRLTAKDLDRWLVQVLSQDGTKLHRSCRLGSQRHYVLESQDTGGQRLVAIEHELLIDREELKRTGGQLGLANLDEVEASTAQISKVPFPGYK